jgi:hypothetical protein
MITVTDENSKTIGNTHTTHKVGSDLGLNKSRSTSTKGYKKPNGSLEEEEEEEEDDDDDDDDDEDSEEEEAEEGPLRTEVPDDELEMVWPRVMMEEEEEEELEMEEEEEEGLEMEEEDSSESEGRVCKRWEVWLGSMRCKQAQTEMKEGAGTLMYL